MELASRPKKYFFSVVMVNYCDSTSSKLVDEMISKAKSGVDVRLIVEGVWANLILKKCVKKMREGGVKVLLSKGFFKPKTLFTVMHDKFWISDGEMGIVGGQNMHDFENASNGFNDHTRDKDVLISSGPAVTDLLKQYILLWDTFKKKDTASIDAYKSIVDAQLDKERLAGMRGKSQYNSVLLNKRKRSKGVCRFIVQGDQTDRSLIGETYKHLIAHSKDSIVFNSPTFRMGKKESKLNTQLINLMMAKAKYSNLRIELLSNGVDGSWGEAGFQVRQLIKKLKNKGSKVTAKLISDLEYALAKSNGKKNWKHLKKFSDTKNIQAWTYFNHVHAKQMLFDRVLTSTGSYNFDSHSYKNHESTLLCFDDDLVQETEDNFTLDMVNSIPVL